MTTDEVLFGLGLVVVLAVGSQLLAGFLRVPGLVVLLPAGFLAGIATGDVHPDKLLGAVYQPFVSIAGGVILFGACRQRPYLGARDRYGAQSVGCRGADMGRPDRPADRRP